MFLCKGCTKDSARWKFNLKMTVSYGKCGHCGKAKLCVDQSASCIKKSNK